MGVIYETSFHLCVKHDFSRVHIWLQLEDLNDGNLAPPTPKASLYTIRIDPEIRFSGDGTRSVTLLKVPDKGSSFLTKFK